MKISDCVKCGSKSGNCDSKSGNCGTTTCCQVDQCIKKYPCISGCPDQDKSKVLVRADNKVLWVPSKCFIGPQGPGATGIDVPDIGEFLAGVTGAEKILATGRTGPSPVIQNAPGANAEGCGTQALGNCSHAEGALTIAGGDYSHAEGLGSVASGQASHAEGLGSIASGLAAHAEGDPTLASGAYSHAEGHGTIASGTGAHAGGFVEDDLTVSSINAMGIGSLARGAVRMTGSIIVEPHAYGSHAHGVALFAGKIAVMGNSFGSEASGYAQGDGQIVVQDVGLVGGPLGAYASGFASQGIIQASRNGARVTGYAVIESKIYSTERGSMIHGFTRANGLIGITGGTNPTIGGQVIIGSAQESSFMSINGNTRGCQIMGSARSASTLKITAIGNNNSNGDQIFGDAITAGQISINNSSGVMAQGRVESGGQIVADNTFGSFLGGNVSDSGKIVIDSSNGSQIYGSVAQNSEMSIGTNSFGCSIDGHAENNGQALINACIGSEIHGTISNAKMILGASSGSQINGLSNLDSLISITGSVGGQVNGYTFSDSKITMDGCGGSQISGLVFMNSEISMTESNGSRINGYAIDNGKLTMETGLGSQIDGYVAKFASIESSGLGSHARGASNNYGLIKASGNGAIASGYVDSDGDLGGLIEASGTGSYAGGYIESNLEQNLATGSGSFVYGHDLRNSNNNSAMFGRHGIAKTSITGSGGVGAPDPTTIMGDGSLQIAGGVDGSATDGISVALGTYMYSNTSPIGGGIADFWHTSGADYAEYFEWADGNLDAEDRIGYFVQIKPGSEQIELATESQEVIGVVSSINGTAGIIANGASLHWQGANLRDEFGRVQSTMGTAGPETVSNPDFDPNMVYVPRSARIEWSPIGLMGQLYVRDNGECLVGQRCDCQAGIAIPGSTWRVLKRSGSNVIKILLLGGR